MLFRDGNLWLPQAGIAELFGVQKAAVSKHLKNIFAEGELPEQAVVSKMETTAADGKRYGVTYYGIKAIIAVGYRVNSERATAFRIWATNTLEEFVRKGFVLNDEMLKNGKPFGQDKVPWVYGSADTSTCGRNLPRSGNPARERAVRYVSDPSGPGVSVRVRPRF